MRKIKFAAQIFILLVSFPALFIAGISYPVSKEMKTENMQQESPAVTKDISEVNGRTYNESKPDDSFAYYMLLNKWLQQKS